MRVCVYAISKNESTFVKRWMNSMQEADEVIVLDTGSTDDTVEQLRMLGAQVTEERIEPWRFDTARNRSLALVPKNVDICVCTDLDEVFHPGWRALLEAAWQPEITRACYRYIWSFLPDGREGHVFWLDKVHAREGYCWTHPVHEVLTRCAETPEKRVNVSGMLLEHHPDPGKSRGQYLPLLELSVREDPEDDRNMHYLGREYMFCGQWQKAINTLKRHLSLPRATWVDERCASMRFLARCYDQLGQKAEACRWRLRAAAEAPHLREPMMELADSCYHAQDWEGVCWWTKQALTIADRPQTYITEAFAWGSLPWDLRAIALYRLGRRKEALESARAALALEPENNRLKQNMELMQEQMDE